LPATQLLELTFACSSIRRLTDGEVTMSEGAPLRAATAASMAAVSPPADAVQTCHGVGSSGDGGSGDGGDECLRHRPAMGAAAESVLRAYYRLLTDRGVLCVLF